MDVRTPPQSRGASHGGAHHVLLHWLYKIKAVAVWFRRSRFILRCPCLRRTGKQHLVRMNCVRGAAWWDLSVTRRRINSAAAGYVAARIIPPLDDHFYGEKNVIRRRVVYPRW